MRKDIFVAAVQDQRDALLQRLSSLPPGHWDAVCPAAAPPADVVRLESPPRTVRDVVAHLLVVDELALRGGTLRAPDGVRRLEHPGGWDLRRVAPVSAQSGSDLLDALARRGERFTRVVATAPAALHRLPVPGPFGRQPLGRLIGRRVLHEWLHEQDIALATAAGPVPPAEPASEAVAQVLADSVLQMLPADALPRTGLTTGTLRIVVDVAGPRPAGQAPVRCIWGVDFGRRQFGPRVVRPADATVRLPAATLALLAHGRGARVDQAAAPSIEGDQTLGARVLAAIAVAEPAELTVEHAAGQTVSTPR